MVARAHDRVREGDDPTAHAVIVALREAARKLGADRLADATIFATLEPCAMCVGALLESDVEALVYALAERSRRRRRDRHPARPARMRCGGRIKVVSGIRRDEAARALRDRIRRARRLTRRRGRAARAGSDPAVWYPLPRRGVRVVDGAALEKRCAKAPRVRIPPSPPQTVVSARPMPALARPRARSRTRRVRSEFPSRERSPSGLWRRTGNAVWGNPSRVRIPPSPPLPVELRRLGVSLAGPC